MVHEAIEQVREEFVNNPHQSLRRAAQALGMCKSSVHVILKKKLNLKPYKIQKHHALKERHCYEATGIWMACDKEKHNFNRINQKNRNSLFD